SPTFYYDDPFVSHPDSSEKVPGVIFSLAAKEFEQLLIAPGSFTTFELVICGPRRATVPDTLPTTHYQGHCSLVGLLRLPAMTPAACYQGHCSLAGPIRLPCHVANRLLSGALFAGRPDMSALPCR
ncbi:hypothetical protein B296_00030486, partial [Ensete ventricosum]